MDMIKENFVQPLITSHFEKCRVPFSAIPQEILQCREEKSDSETIMESNSYRVEKVDLRNLPQLRISLERICLSVKTPKTKDPTVRNLLIDKNLLIGSESDDSSQTVVISDKEDEMLAINEELERMEVDSGADSQENLISSDMDAIASDNRTNCSEDSPLIHDLSEIFVRLEKIPLPKAYICEDENELSETDELEIGKNLEKRETRKCSLPTCYVSLERINVKTVSPRNYDLPSPLSTSKTSYGHCLPEPVIRLERTPASVFRKYGITIPEHSPSSSDGTECNSRSDKPDKKLYCVLGIKLLFQKRKQENLFEERVSQLRDYIIPERNSVKNSLSAKRKFKRLQRKNLFMGRALSFENYAQEMTERHYY